MRVRKDYLPTLRELILAERYQDEAMCRQIVGAKLHDIGGACPECGRGKLSWAQHSNGTWGVYCSRGPGVCPYKVAVLKGTMFHGTKLSMLAWFKAIDIVYRTRGRVTVAIISKETGLSPPRARKIIADIRRELGLPDGAGLARQMLLPRHKVPKTGISRL